MASMSTGHEHRVCTYAEAEKAIRGHKKIYVNDCFCRGPAKEGKAAWKYCGHSIDTCMGFEKPKDAPYEVREIGPREAIKRFEEWKAQGNLFRFMEGEKWVCFCCSCGCGWFRAEDGSRKKDPCGTSTWIEKTDKAKCTLCGACVPVCAYEARSVDGGKIKVKASSCYGCSACEYACPEGAIEMVKRKPKAGKTR